LILEPLANQKVQFLDEAVDAILEQSGGHPYFLQLLCSNVIDYLNERQTNYVLYGTVQEVVQRIVGQQRQAYDHFAYLWDHAEPVSRLILALLLASDEPLNDARLWDQLLTNLSQQQVTLPQAWLREQYERDLLRLQNVGEAIVRDSQGCYGFGIPLFRYWLRERGRRENLSDKAVAAVLDEFQRVTRHG
jgi:hypothetical protein